MADINRCPECGEKVFRDDFQCAECGLLLHPEQATGEYVLTDPSIVRALISPIEPRTSAEHLADFSDPLDEVVTERFQLPITDQTVPTLVAKLDVALKPLHPFEALVASFLDGKSTVGHLLKVCRIPPVELKAVIATLHQRGIVELRESEKPKPPPKKAAQPKPPPPPRADVPIEDVPTNPRRKKVQGAFSKALDEIPPSRVQPAPAPRGNLMSRAAIDKALENAKKGKAASLQERVPELPDKPEEYLQRAIALEREGKVDGAIYVLNRAIAQVKKPAPLYNKLALILLNQRKDYREAEALLRKALAADPGNPVYEQNLYKVLGLAAAHKSGKHDAASIWAKLRGK